MNTYRMAMNEPTSTIPRISQRLRRASAVAVSASLAVWGTSSSVESFDGPRSGLDPLSPSLPPETDPVSLKALHLQQGHDATLWLMPFLSNHSISFTPHV